MPVATQRATPDATPVTPFDVCHVTLAIPAPPEAVPLTDIVDAAAETTGETGDAMDTLMRPSSD
jgi:hypothetical protein